MAAEQDRRSRMAYTTYKAPAKKNGAGGAYTWGSPLDSTTFYNSRVTAAPGVTLARAPIAQPSVAVAQSSPGITDRVAFPSLGSARKPISSSPQSPTVSSASTSAPKPAKVLGDGVVRLRSAGSVECSQPVSYQSRPVEQDRRSPMAYTTYKEPAKKDSAGCTFTQTQGSRLHSASPYDSRATAAPGVTPTVQPNTAIAQTIWTPYPGAPPAIEEQPTQPIAIAAQKITEGPLAPEIVQVFDEKQPMEDEPMQLTQEKGIEPTMAAEVPGENADLVMTADVAAQVEERTTVNAPDDKHEEAASPSEISAEEAASEDSSSRLPMKTNATTTTRLSCLRGCFEWMPSKRV